MCVKKDTDTVLHQLELCENTEEMRWFLNEAILCRQCCNNPETGRTSEEGCSCLQHSRAEFQKVLSSFS
jgi:membrane carboxypeptidase/penicillin-binding protein PbpC